MLLDRFIHRWDFRERHAITIQAPPARVLPAIKRLTPSDVPLAKALMRLRSIPSLLAGRKTFLSQSEKPFLDQIVGNGFLLLGEDSEKELLLGTIGRFWKASGEFCLAVQTPEDFLSFQEAGRVKVGWNFFVETSANGTRVQTETRILATDRPARWKFFAYWLLVRPGSGMIRKAILRSVRRVLEKEDGLS
ncbi:MAG: hypothetical protein HYW57_04600 [Ignavibacteriales bacterium]|nr:hypothetical protein [Ignavibacteriales bacterium]